MSGPTLLDQVRTTAALRHLSPRTADAYTHWIRRFILFHNKRHPLEMRAPEVHMFLSHLAQTLKVSASTQNQALNAVAFLYHQVLQRELGEIGELPRARRPKTLPVVFFSAEVRKVLSNLTGTEYLMASLLYGSGLRLTEGISLRVKDIDFEGRLVVVHQGKGSKDRVTMLPNTILPNLRRQLERVQEIHHQDLAHTTPAQRSRNHSNGNILMPQRNLHGNTCSLPRDVALNRTPDANAVTTSTRASSSGPSRSLSFGQGFQRTEAVALSATPLQLASWNRAATFALFRNSSVIAMYGQL